MKLTNLIFALIFPAILFAQDPLPTTNVFLFNYRQINDSSMVFYRPQMLTGFNKTGYNNQPSFFSNNEIYLSAQTPGTAQTDIYKLDPISKKKYRVTNTSTPEYSPTLTPDGKHFSVIRVETDGRQRIWKLPIDRSSPGKPILPHMTNIGYHFWLNENEIALFIVGGKSNSFSIANLQTGNVMKLGSSIGRCFQRTTSGNLAYVFKATENTSIIQEMDIITKKPKRLIKTLGDSEDFVVLPDGTFLTAHKSTIYKFHPAFDVAWLPVADFSYYGIKNITRLAASGNNRLAVVSGN